MLETIKIVKQDGWKLISGRKVYDISTADEGIMNILKPSNNQTCIITNLTSDNAICYFVKTDSAIQVYSYPDNMLLVSSDYYLDFFSKLEIGTKYYLIPTI